MKLVNKNTGDVIATNVQTAYSFWRRFRGLMLKENMPEGSALHIAPCPSIHTFFMKFSIDILYLNKENEIVGVEKELAPGKIGKRFAGGYSVIEFPTGGICDLAVHIGDTLDFVDEGWEYGS
ncbi:DUF192 domain-containing protein [Virgibacillus siamensis]|uniref:DUF192 domain-containing protein n=1 Tax=Virgibacillus siamensis TaxID=480071 RepID=A0ABP3QHH5_9BACI